MKTDVKNDLTNFALILIIVAVIALLGNWVFTKGANPLLESLPGMLILMAVAFGGILLSKLVPKITSIIWITIIGILLAMPASPTSEYVVTQVGKIQMLPLATPILAYAGVNMGKDWKEFKRIGWKGIIVAVLVMFGTFIGSAIIAHFVLKAQGII